MSADSILLDSSSLFNDRVFSLTVNVTWVPTPTWEVNNIAPPKLSTNFFDIVSPIPVPLQLYLFRCLLTILNILNRFGMSLSSMPSPVSDTLNSSSRTRSNNSTSKSVLLLTVTEMPIMKRQFDVKAHTYLRLAWIWESSISSSLELAWCDQRQIRTKTRAGRCLRGLWT